MKVFHGTDEYRELIRKTGSVKGTAVALGKFDGIHLGHARLIDAMINEAGKRGLSTLLFTFDKPFASFFTGEKPEVLTTNKEREEAVRDWGIDFLLEYPLRSDTVSVSPEDFVDHVLVEAHVMINFYHLLHLRRHRYSFQIFPLQNQRLFLGEINQLGLFSLE